MDDNDFYEDDEPIEDVRRAWREGEPGVTSGPRSLDAAAQFVVDSAAFDLSTINLHDNTFARP